MKCSRCGEEYSGSICPVCGAQEPEQEPPAEKEDSLFSMSQPGSEGTDTAAQPEPPSGKKKKRKGKRALIAVIIILVVLLAFAACLFTFGKGFLSKILPGYFGEALADLSGTGGSGMSQSQGTTWGDIWASSAATVSERNDNAAQAAAQQEIEERMEIIEESGTFATLLIKAVEVNFNATANPQTDILSAKSDLETAMNYINQATEYLNNHPEIMGSIRDGMGLYNSFVNDANTAADYLNAAVDDYNAGNTYSMYLQLSSYTGKRADMAKTATEIAKNYQAYIDETERMAEELLN